MTSLANFSAIFFWTSWRSSQRLAINFTTSCGPLWPIATYCDILRLIANYCAPLPPIATYCILFQHVATFCGILWPFLLANPKPNQYIHRLIFQNQFYYYYVFQKIDIAKPHVKKGCGLLLVVMLLSPPSPHQQCKWTNKHFYDKIKY